MKYSLFIFLLLPLLAGAQIEDDDWHYGFRLGATYSSIDEISTTLIRPIYPQESYNTSIEPLIGFTGGFFVYYRFRNSKFAVQSEISYAQQGSRFNYDDIEELQYNIDMKYGYLRVGPMIKVYPVAGLHLSLGAQVGFVTNNTNLDYVSNKPDLGPDLQIQQSLRQVLKGTNNVALQVGLGYELPIGLSLDVRYGYGITDVVETLANGFYFIENDNRNLTLEVNVGYAIPFFN